MADTDYSLMWTLSASLKAKVDRKFICTACHRVLRNSVQTICGHRFCESCIADGDTVCAGCDRKLSAGDIVSDFGVRRDMRKRHVTCCADCDWSGTLFDWPEHQDDCVHIQGETECRSPKNDDIFIGKNRKSTEKRQTDIVNNHIYTFRDASYDGTFLWIVDDFSRQKDQAMDGHKSYLDSHPFMTSRKGYRLCVRLYPNGNGLGKNTHLSLFAVLMRGPNDDTLDWPFRQKITLELLDQSTENRRNMVDHIYPDPGSSSFQKPGPAHNPAMGLVQFMPLSQLNTPWHTYVLDDTLIIRVSVD